MTSITVISVLVGYAFILLGIALWGSKESQDLKGYYVAGKRLPAWVIAFSSNATGESAWLLLGLTGMGYAIGVHAFWVILGECWVSHRPGSGLLAHSRNTRIVSTQSQFPIISLTGFGTRSMFSVGFRQSLS